MSYSRALDQIEADLNETRKDSPCEAAQLVLYRGVAKRILPNALVQKAILDEVDSQLDNPANHTHVENCRNLNKTPFNFLFATYAGALGNGTAFFGTQTAQKLVKAGENYLGQFQRQLKNCQGDRKFYHNETEENRRSLDLAVTTANDLQEDLREFQGLHQRCIRENSKRR